MIPCFPMLFTQIDRTVKDNLGPRRIGLIYRGSLTGFSAIGMLDHLETVPFLNGFLVEMNV